MESWPGQEKRVQMVLAAPIEEATPELAFEAAQRFHLQVKRALTASQLAELRQVWENRRPLEELERPAMSRLLVWRSGRQALVSFAPVQPQLMPSRG
jgi:hypothetical protein